MNEDFREFLHVIFKRKRFVTLAFLLTSLPIIAMAMLRPKPYRASAKLLLVGNRSYVQLAPQEQKRASPMPDTQVINAEVENLKNWSFLIAAADRLDIDLVSDASSDVATAQRSSSGERVPSRAIAILGPIPVTVCTCSKTVRSSGSANP